MKIVSIREEKTARKGENAIYHKFLLFLQRFRRLPKDHKPQIFQVMKLKKNLNRISQPM